jgi:hypothetical protein
LPKKTSKACFQGTFALPFALQSNGSNVPVILKITERCIAKQRKQGGAKLVFSGFAYFIKQRKGFANLVCKT